MRSLPFRKPEPGLIPLERPRDRLAQFFELRRAFYHCEMLMKELEQQTAPEVIAPIFSKATARLALAAAEFSESDRPGAR